MTVAMEAVDSQVEEAAISDTAPVGEEIPEDYGYTEEEDAIAAMIMLNGNTNVHDKLFQEEAV